MNSSRCIVVALCVLASAAVVATTTIPFSGPYLIEALYSTSDCAPRNISGLEIKFQNVCIQTASGSEIFSCANMTAPTVTSFNSSDCSGAPNTTAVAVSSCDFSSASGRWRVKRCVQDLSSISLIYGNTPAFVGFRNGSECARAGASPTSLRLISLCLPLPQPIGRYIASKKTCANNDEGLALCSDKDCFYCDDNSLTPFDDECGAENEKPICITGAAPPPAAAITTAAPPTDPLPRLPAVPFYMIPALYLTSTCEKNSSAAVTAKLTNACIPTGASTAEMYSCSNFSAPTRSVFQTIDCSDEPTVYNMPIVSCSPTETQFWLKSGCANDLSSVAVINDRTSVEVVYSSPSACGQEDAVPVSFTANTACVPVPRAGRYIAARRACGGVSLQGRQILCRDLACTDCDYEASLPSNFTCSADGKQQICIDTTPLPPTAAPSAKIPPSSTPTTLNAPTAAPSAAPTAPSAATPSTTTTSTAPKQAPTPQIARATSITFSMTLFLLFILAAMLVSE